MIFGEGVVGILLLGLVLFCLLDVITSDPAAIRNLPKVAWMLLVLIPIGSIAWLIAGRPQNSAGGLPYKGNAGARPTGRPGPARPKPRRGVAPDDDPAFLADLKRSNNEHEEMLGTWEHDLRRREEELRRARDEDDKP